ncbi:unnamed protein product [Lymnaea stagnalis]|uniref:MICOS complex subunit MIC10 n=1 Tax=Lymnaea stagnalis TaxID=6523 RepID=A0AAV2H3S5_LYMST
MASSNGNSKRSEDVYGQKIDRCLYNALMKFVGGVGVGIVFSALLFKRKPWPVLLGVGVGMGMGISDCNHEFKGPVKVKTTGMAMRGKSPPPASDTTVSTPYYKRQRCSKIQDSEACCERKKEGLKCNCGREPSQDRKPCFLQKPRGRD